LTGGAGAGNEDKGGLGTEQKVMAEEDEESMDL